MTIGTKIECLCCGHVESFPGGAQEAYEAGWDVAPYFTLQPLCNLCPSSWVLIHGLEGARERHKRAHDLWDQEGRPRP